MNLAKYEIELRRGSVLIIVLSLLFNEHYGYQLVAIMNEMQFAIDTNTLYPLLRRLEKEEILKSRTAVFDGRERKYYQITNKGQELYASLLEEYQKIDKIIAEFAPIKIRSDNGKN